MAVYRLETNNPVTFTDHTGVRIVKNPLLKPVFLFNGDGNITITGLSPNPSVDTRIVATVNHPSNATNHIIFGNTAENFNWHLRYDTTADLVVGRPFQTGLLFESNVTIPLNTDVVMEYLWDGNNPLTATIKTGSDVVTLDNITPAAGTGDLVIGANNAGAAGWVGAISDVYYYENDVLIHWWPIDEGAGTVITDKVGALNGLLTVGTGAWFNDPDYEIAGGPTGSVETSPSNILSYTGITWVTAPITGDIFEWQYDGSGNYTDSDSVAMEAQTLTLVNCLDPIGTYTPSIYAGTKDINGTEALATGVTKIQVSNVIGTGTIQLLVDGVNVNPIFDTTTTTSFHWAVSGSNVSWVMTGVTAFDLGQGK